MIDCSMTQSRYICQLKHENPKAASVCCHGMCAIYNNIIVVCSALLCCVVVCCVVLLVKRGAEWSGVIRC